MTTLELIKESVNNTIKMENEIIASMQKHDFATAIYLDKQQRQIKDNLKTLAKDNGLNKNFAEILKRSMD